MGKPEDLIERIAPHIPRRGKKRKEALPATECLRGNVDRRGFLSGRESWKPDATP